MTPIHIEVFETQDMNSYTTNAHTSQVYICRLWYSIQYHPTYVRYIRTLYVSPLTWGRKYQDSDVKLFSRE